MSPVLPFDIYALIIDVVGENKDTRLLKKLALVSHSFHQICIKHLFANVELHAYSKKGFVTLLKSRPNIVDYILKLTYKVSGNNNGDDHLLSPILSNFLPTTSRLNCLSINAVGQDWNTLDSSLTSAFLHLISLPTINHIDLSFIRNFPLSSLTLSVNLLRLDMSLCFHYPEEDSFFKTIQSEMFPKIRVFHTSNSDLLTMKLLDVKGQDGRPVFNFMDLRQLSISFFCVADYLNIQCLLGKAKLLERLHLSVGIGLSLVGVFSTGARTLKSLDLTVPLFQDNLPPLAELYDELEAMVGHNTLEVLSLKVCVEAHHRDYSAIGSTIQKVENILVKPGWSALRQVSFKLPIRYRCHGEDPEFIKALQSLPDKYLSHLSKLESVAFNYSAYHAYLVRN